MEQCEIIIYKFFVSLGKKKSVLVVRLMFLNLENFYVFIYFVVTAILSELAVIFILLHYHM